MATSRIAEGPVVDPAEEDPLGSFDLRAAPGHLLRRNHQRSYELFAARVGDAATRQQFALLLTLAQRPGSSQNELVEMTGMDKSTLKELLGRLVSRRWVERERDPADNRAWTMRITPAGRALIEELLPRVAAAQRVQLLLHLRDQTDEFLVFFLQEQRRFAQQLDVVDLIQGHVPFDVTQIRKFITRSTFFWVNALFSGPAGRGVAER